MTALQDFSCTHVHVETLTPCPEKSGADWSRFICAIDISVIKFSVPSVETQWGQVVGTNTIKLSGKARGSDVYLCTRATEQRSMKGLAGD